MNLLLLQSSSSFDQIACVDVFVEGEIVVVVVVFVVVVVVVVVFVVVVVVVVFVFLLVVFNFFEIRDGK